MSPFDRAYYDALSKGLEFSETTLKELVARWDAEFYTGKFARYSRLMKLRGCTYFEKEAKKVVKGAFDITAAQYQDSGVPFVRIANLGGMRVDSGEMAYIDEATHAQYLASESRRGDILLSKTAYAAASIVTLEKCNSSQDTIAISLKSDSVLDAYFTVVYLNTQYGLFLMGYLFTGNIQSHFNLADCKNKLPIPVFSGVFQARIREFFEKALATEEKSRELYREASQQLLIEIGLSNWSPSDKSVSTKMYSECVSVGRFDAEYFLPKSEAITQKIYAYQDGTVAASSLLVSGLVKESDKTLERYIELADIGENGEIIGCRTDEFCNLPSRARQRIGTGQVIVSSVEGSLDRCALVTEEYDKAICSTGFHRFHSKDINSETLLLLFKSWPIQQLLKKGCSGTILSAILPGELAHVPLPLVRESIQTELAKKVQSSFALHAESKRLLDLAKRAVEIAIEQGEANAEIWLNTQAD